MATKDKTVTDAETDIDAEKDTDTENEIFEKDASIVCFNKE